MIKIYGNLEIDNGVRIVTTEDLCLYYKWFIDKYLYKTIHTQLPRHLAHCTIYNPSIHGDINLNSIRHLDKIPVDFWIDPVKLYESKMNFWIPVVCPMEKFIKNLLKIKDGPNYWGLHLTVCNKGKIGKPNEYLQRRI